jgi:hypothetical protein
LPFPNRTSASLRSLSAECSTCNGLPMREEEIRFLPLVWGCGFMSPRPQGCCSAPASWPVKAHCYTFRRSVRPGPVLLSHFHHRCVLTLARSSGGFPSCDEESNCHWKRSTSPRCIATGGQSWCWPALGQMTISISLSHNYFLSSSCRTPSLTRGRVYSLQCNHSMVRVARNQ